VHEANLYRLLADHVREGVYVVDRTRRILDWNSAAEQITGYLRQDVVGRACEKDLLMHCDATGRILCGGSCVVNCCMSAGRTYTLMTYLRHKNGHRVPVRVRSAPLRDAQGEITGAVEVFEPADIAGADQAVSLESHGCLDELTGLLVRRYAEMRTGQRLAEMEGFGVPLGWLRIELEGMTELEHRYGQPAVDAMVNLVARTLASNAGSLDLLSRWAPAQFRMAVYNRAPGQLREIANTLASLTATSDLMWWGDLLRATVAVGGVVAIPGDTVQSLERRSAAACETSRSLGPNRATIL
jgi:PAS domain S-box-containing protein